MKTNKWYVDTSDISRVTINRVTEEIPVAEILMSDDMNREQMIDIAHQIVDDWNFSCDELEE